MSNAPTAKNVQTEQTQCTETLQFTGFPASIDEYDKQVFSGICTLIDELADKGKELIVTPQMICETFADTTSSREKELQRVVKSIHKMMSTTISFRYREHKEFVELRENLLYADEIKVLSSRTNTHAFWILKIPRLHGRKQ